MNRNTLEGLWLPRTDLDGWRVAFSDGREFTRDSPGPVASVEVELDTNGCLASGSVSLKNPRYPFFPAFTFTVTLYLHSRTRGEVPVAQGFIPPVREDGREEYTLELRPLEELTLDGYYDGSVAHNTLGEEPAEWNETNRAVLERMLKRSPTASMGVDWAGRFIVAQAGDGSPVAVPRAAFYEWKALPDVVLPYLTASRWNGGPGWKRGEYRGIRRPPLTPERVQDAGEVKFEEVTRPAGMPVVTRRELTVRLSAEDEASTPGLEGLVLEADDLKQPLGAGKLLRRFKGNQYAAVVVLDPQSWYRGSALVGQENEEVSKQRDEVETAQKAYALAVDALGEGSALAAQERATLQAAQTALRLAQVEGGVHESDYEPLSALIPLGFDPHDVGEGVLTGATLWLSTLPWDDAAVGPPAAVNPDPDAPLDEGEWIEGPAIVHPHASEATLQVFEAPMTELTSVSEGKPYQMSQLKIPESYFRGPMGPALGRLMDAAWREQYDPDEPPEGEEPPSKTWDGRWYLHVAAWWQAVNLPNRQVTGNWEDVMKLDRTRLGAVTTGPTIRTRGAGVQAT